MARPCASCSHPRRDEIDRKLKAGTSFKDVSRWLDETEKPITAQSVAVHAKSHLAVAPVIGRRPASDDFLVNVRDAAADALEAGEVAVTLKDGIAAQKALDARLARDIDREWQLRLVLALTGNAPIQIIDPAVEALEAEFRPLLTPGETTA
jgi:hypothetical protein